MRPKNVMIELYIINAVNIIPKKRKIASYLIFYVCIPK